MTEPYGPTSSRSASATVAATEPAPESASTLPSTNPATLQANQEIVSTLSELNRFTGGKEPPVMPACRALSPADLHAQFVGAPETQPINH